MDADVVISWYAENAETQALRAQYQRPTRFIQMPAGPGTNYKEQMEKLGTNAIQAMCKKYLPDVNPLRIALIGFSEGCQGVREALSTGDGSRVDSVIAIDGIHSQWVDKKASTYQSAYLLAWRAFARLAADDGRLMVITTSAVRPDFVDTTTTSTWIWSQATGTIESLGEVAPAELSGPVNPPYTNPKGSFGPGQTGWKETSYPRFPLRLFRRKSGLIVANFSNLDATGVGDHRFQAARVSPLVQQLYLIPRWNSLDPLTTLCSAPGV